MKHIRFSPWLILVLAALLVFAAGCDRPDPQVGIDVNTVPTATGPEQPIEPQLIETPIPGEILPLDGIATPTLPPFEEATVEGVEVIESTPEPGEFMPEPTPFPLPTLAEPQVQPTPEIQPAAPVTAQGNIIHTVKSGETLFSIGRQYGVNPYSIAAANNIPYPYLIYPGQQLTVPTGTTPGPTPAPPPTGQCRSRHTVRPGENLYRLSLAYGVPMATIAAANGIANYNLIYAGQTLCIP
ncbi:Autolysin [Thermoflexales bacterium]|nr:Autolysin [Thermoflexales bacterium]